MKYIATQNSEMLENILEEDTTIKNTQKLTAEYFEQENKSLKMMASKIALKKRNKRLSIKQSSNKNKSSFNVLKLDAVDELRLNLNLLPSVTDRQHHSPSNAFCQTFGKDQNSFNRPIDFQELVPMGNRTFDQIIQMQTPKSAYGGLFPITNREHKSSFRSKRGLDGRKEPQQLTYFGEKQFFDLVVVCVIKNSPKFMQDVLLQKCTTEMFRRAKSLDTKFYQFQEWVENDIQKALYKNQDHDFVEMEQEWLVNVKESEVQQKMIENKNYEMAAQLSPIATHYSGYFDNLLNKSDIS